MLVTITVLSFILFSITALGLNTGIIVHDKAMLQTAVDAAALSGASALPLDDENREREVVARARSLNNGVLPENLEVKVIDERVRVRTHRAPKLFMFTPWKITVEAYAAAFEVLPDSDGNFPEWCFNEAPTLEGKEIGCWTTRLIRGES